MNILTDPIFLPKQIPFGLDLSDLSVKVVQLGFVRGKKNVSAYGSILMPSGCVVDGEVKNPDGVRDAISRVVAGTHLNTKKVFCSLPEGKSFLRVIEVPQLEEDELEEVIRWQVEENIPLGLDQLYYDWMLLPASFSKGKHKRHVLLVAVARYVADAFLEVLESAGLEVVGMGTESVALANSLLLEQSPPDETVLIVDVGDRRTSFTFALGGVPCFSSGTPVSSQMMTDVIAKTLKISNQDAEKLKRESGIGSFIKRDPLFCALESTLNNLVHQTQASIDFFVGSLGFSRSVQRIILCGGGANAEGLPVYLGKQLGKVVERGNPWARLDLNEVVPTIPYKEALAFSTAIGLAGQGLQNMYEEIS